MVFSLPGIRKQTGEDGRQLGVGCSVAEAALGRIWHFPLAAIAYYWLTSVMPWRLGISLKKPLWRRAGGRRARISKGLATQYAVSIRNGQAFDCASFTLINKECLAGSDNILCDNAPQADTPRRGSTAYPTPCI